MTETASKLLAFTARLKAEARERYVALHADPPPAILALLRAAHVGDYHIFVDGDRLFGFFRYSGSDYEGDMARLGTDPASIEWHRLTAACQIVPEGAEDGWTTLAEIFTLDGGSARHD